jgi:hypothetical protein
MPDHPISGRGDKKEIALARSWDHHTPPVGSTLCTTILCALTYIYSPHTGVGCSRYVVRVSLREGVGLLPALVLDLG